MAQINKPNQYFNTKLYTGTGSSQSITGVGFQPDWVWIKNRSGTDWHIGADFYVFKKSFHFIRPTFKNPWAKCSTCQHIITDKDANKIIEEQKIKVI